MLHISIPPIITQATQKPSAQKKMRLGKIPWKLVA